MDKNQATEFIKTSREKGVSDESIITTLKLNGWSETDIAEYFKTPPSTTGLVSASVSSVQNTPQIFGKTLQRNKFYGTVIGGALVMYIFVPTGLRLFGFNVLTEILSIFLLPTLILMIIIFSIIYENNSFNVKKNIGLRSVDQKRRLKREVFYSFLVGIDLGLFILFSAIDLAHIKIHEGFAGIEVIIIGIPLAIIFFIIGAVGYEVSRSIDKKRSMKPDSHIPSSQFTTTIVILVICFVLFYFLKNTF
jgi:uncharacterized membrane protein YccF (DUF307 family)